MKAIRIKSLDGCFIPKNVKYKYAIEINYKEGILERINMKDKLILLERKHPTIYEIHRGEINTTKNIVLITHDSEFAKRIVKGYNNSLK